MKIKIIIIILGIIGLATTYLFCQKWMHYQATKDWPRYFNERMQYEIKYPPEAIIHDGDCPTFYLTDLEHERKFLESPDRVDMAMVLEGLTVGICSSAYSGGQKPINYAKETERNFKVKPVFINWSLAAKISSSQYAKYFIQTPDKMILEISYRYGKDQYRPIAKNIISTFKFID